jgi:Na+/H+ antiporter NhaD/arsenite permease-like protein
LVTYLFIAIESGRGSHLDRTAVAFCGAVAMVLAGVLSLNDAYKIIDWNTLLFLLGMMILVAHFQISGFFDGVAIHVALVARTRFELLVLLVFSRGILSAFFVNDTICLVLAPLVFVVTDRLKIPPVPYLIAVAFSSNTGSVTPVREFPYSQVS